MMRSSNGNNFRVTGRLRAESPYKGQWSGSLMFSSIWAWINDWVNNREAGDLRHHCAHYDVTVLELRNIPPPCITPSRNVLERIHSGWATLGRKLSVGAVDIMCSKRKSGVSETDIKGRDNEMNPTVSVGCSYLSLLGTCFWHPVPHMYVISFTCSNTLGKSVHELDSYIIF